MGESHIYVRMKRIVNSERRRGRDISLLLPANSNDQQGRWDDNVIFRYIFFIELYTYICMAHSMRAQRFCLTKRFLRCRNYQVTRCGILYVIGIWSVFIFLCIRRRDKKTMWADHRSHIELCVPLHLNVKLCTYYCRQIVINFFYGNYYSLNIFSLRLYFINISPFKYYSTQNIDVDGR